MARPDDAWRLNGRFEPVVPTEDEVERKRSHMQRCMRRGDGKKWPHRVSIRFAAVTQRAQSRQLRPIMTPNGPTDMRRVVFHGTPLDGRYRTEVRTVMQGVYEKTCSLPCIPPKKHTW